MKAKRRDHFELHTDGSSLPTNPGNLGAGYILRNGHGRQIEARGCFCGKGSCNQAEYEALVLGVEAALRHGARRLDILSDSMLIVRQIQRRWKVKAPGLKSYHAKALVLLGRLRYWRIAWIPREQNRAADILAGNASKFKRDVDYGGLGILGGADDGRDVACQALQEPERRESVRRAVKDYFRGKGRNGKRRRRKPKPSGTICDERDASHAEATAGVYRERMRQKQLRTMNMV